MAGEGKFIDNLSQGDVKIDGKVYEDNDKRVLFEKFTNAPVMSAALGSAATATSANIMQMGVNTFLTTPIVGQTLIAPVVTASGLNIAGDQVSNDGREIDFSGAGASAAMSPYSYTVGGGAFYAKLNFSLADVSGTDVCLFGFRKAAAHAADYNDFTDMVALNVVSGDIKIASILNDAATVTTDTTDDWADTETHTLEVYVSVAGVVTYKIDGVAPTVTAAITLDATDVMIPFISFLQDTDFCETIILKELECGLQ